MIWEIQNRDFQKSKRENPNKSPIQKQKLLLTGNKQIITTFPSENDMVNTTVCFACNFALSTLAESWRRLRVAPAWTYVDCPRAPNGMGPQCRGLRRTLYLRMMPDLTRSMHPQTSTRSLLRIILSPPPQPHTIEANFARTPWKSSGSHGPQHKSS